MCTSIHRPKIGDVVVISAFVCHECLIFSKNASLGGPAHSFSPIFFILAGMPFFDALNLAKNWTERSRLFDMMVNTIAYPVKLPGAMPTICSEISQFSNRHAMLNHFCCGMTIFDFPFWSISGYYLKKNSVGSNANKDKDDNLLLSSSARSLTPGEGAATRPKQSAPRHLPRCRSPLLQLVGS
jgi:hypothetical protein